MSTDPKFGLADGEADSEVFDSVFASYVDRLLGGEAVDVREIEEQYPTFCRQLIRQLGFYLNLGHETPAPQSRALGDYTLRRPLGRGGMGVVYEAWQHSVERRVALKVLPAGLAADDRAVARFAREARLASKLHHANVVGVFGMGVEAETPYFAMEFVEGETLAQIVARARALVASASGSANALPEHLARSFHAVGTGGGPIEDGRSEGDDEPSADEPAVDGTDLIYFGRLARSFAGAAEGLHHAHSCGIVHRDVKPSNLILDVQGHLRVLDFGLARFEDGQSLTLSTAVIGTPAYMSPEQARRRQTTIDHRADIFSLGVSLYEMLTGEPAFRGRDREHTLSQIVESEPPPPRILNPQVPRDLETITLKCLRKEPDDRYKTAEALAQDLRRFVRGEPIEAVPQTRWEQVARACWNRRRALIGAAVVTMCLMVGVIVSAALIQQEKDEAILERDAARENLYLARLRLGHQDWADGQVERLLGLLEATRPAPDEPDLRGWEWYYLLGLCHREERTLEGHRGAVLCASWSPDGTVIASGGMDGTVRLWDGNSGKPLSVLTPRYEASPDEPGPSGTRAVAWSPDGRLIAGAFSKGVVAIWNASTGTQQALLGQQAGELAGRNVWCVAWEPTGEHLAVAGHAGEVLLWDLSEGVVRETLEVDTGIVRCLAWNPDGTQLLVAGNIDGPAWLWDVAAGTTQRWKAHKQAINAVSWHPDGNRFLTTGWDQLVRLWTLPITEPQHELSTHSGPLKTVAWSRDGRSFASAGADARIRVRDAETMEEIGVLRGHRRSVEALDWSPDGRLVSASFDGTLKLWHPGVPQEMTQLDAGSLTVWDPSGRRLLTNGPSAAELVDVASGETLRTVAPVRLRTASWSSDGERIVFVRPGELRLRVLEVTAWTEIFTAEVPLPSPENLREVRCVAWHPQDDRLAVGGPGHQATIWQLGQDEPLLTLGGHENNVGTVAWSPDGERLASGSWDQVVRIWDARTGSLLLELERYDRASGPWGGDGQANLAWSPSGAELAAGGSRGEVFVWDALNGEERLRVRGHTSNVRCVTWSPDGHRLASSGEDSTVRVWDPTSGAELLVLRGHVRAVVALSWSPDGSRIASGGGPEVNLWDASPGFVAAEDHTDADSGR